jgi:hypothetical protein
MAEIIEYRPELGGVEAHRALAKKRLEDAEFDFERLKTKNLGQEVIAAAQLRLDEARAAYEAFLKGLPEDSKDPKMQTPENGLH